MPFFLLFPPPALVPKEHPMQMGRNHGNRPLISACWQHSPPALPPFHINTKCSPGRGKQPFSSRINTPAWGCRGCFCLPHPTSEHFPPLNTNRTSSLDSWSWGFREKPLKRVKSWGEGLEEMGCYSQRCSPYVLFLGRGNSRFCLHPPKRVGLSHPQGVWPKVPSPASPATARPGT